MAMEHAAPSAAVHNVGIGPSVSMMPLSMARSGEERRVKAIRGKDDIQRFLRNLGFVEDTPVTVVSELNGNVIVQVMGARVAISRAMASRILTA